MFIRVHSWLVLRVALWLALCPAAQAHQGSSSYLTLTRDGNSLTGQWDVSLIDLDQVAGLDADKDGDITWGEVKTKRPEIERYAKSRLHFQLDGREAPWSVTDLLIDQFSDGAYAVLRLSMDTSAAPTALAVDYRAFFDIDPLHRGLFRLQGFGREQTAVFSPDHPAFVLEPASDWRQFAGFARDGVWHIWKGFDHILFLLALLLPSVLKREAGGWHGVDRFRPAALNVLKIVTAFTVAHSITLTLATLGVVRLPARVAEPAIAASVIVAALNNIRPIVAERGWIVAFGFGLVHGFGFANGLAELGLGRETLALALVGFNLGVELGQLAIVAIFLPVAYALRASWVYQRLTFRFGSAVIAMLAATWMMERLLNQKWLPF